MALINTLTASLADIAKRTDPSGKIAEIAEVLTQQNDILLDCRWMMGNLPTGHRTTIRTGLPTVYWRLLNQGVPPSKSTTAQVDEACALMEAYSRVDKKLIDLAADGPAYRLSEDTAFKEAMNQQLAQTMFYGSASTPERFIGLVPRYSTKAGAVNGQNILDAGGVGTDNTSIWLVVWGDRKAYGIVPKQSTAGLKHTDLGEQTVYGADGVTGSMMQALVSHFTWDAGLVVEDWRYVVRTANIDVSNLVTESSAADLVKYMVRMIDRVPNFNGGSPAFYVNRTVASMLRIQALNKTQNVLSIESGLNQFGDTILTLKFLGIPIRIVDQILETEDRVI